MGCGASKSKKAKAQADKAAEAKKASTKDSSTKTVPDQKGVNSATQADKVSLKDEKVGSVPPQTATDGTGTGDLNINDPYASKVPDDPYASKVPDQQQRPPSAGSVSAGGQGGQQPQRSASPSQQSAQHAAQGRPSSQQSMNQPGSQQSGPVVAGGDMGRAGSPTSQGSVPAGGAAPGRQSPHQQQQQQLQQIPHGGSGQRLDQSGSQQALPGQQQPGDLQHGGSVSGSMGATGGNMAGTMQGATPDLSQPGGPRAQHQINAGADDPFEGPGSRGLGTAMNQVSHDKMAQRQQRELSQMEQEEERSNQREEQEREEARILEYEYDLMRREEDERKLKKQLHEATVKDEQDAKNPNLLSFRVVFIFPGTRRYQYRFHIPKDTGTVFDLKLQINQDFGYEFDQQPIYFRFRPIGDNDVVAKLPDWSPTSCLYCIPEEPPLKDLKKVIRPEMEHCDFDKIKVMNADGPDFPVYRFWAQELSQLQKKSTATVEDRLATEAAIYDLFEAFKTAATHAAELVVHNKVNPVNLDELYGSGGEKFVVAGIVLRKVANWELLNENIGEGDSAFKVAGHELKTINFLQGKMTDVIFPLTCIVDLYGNRFIAMSLLPITTSTLLVGSSTDGLAIQSDPDGNQVGKKIADVLNLKPHTVSDRRSRTEIDLNLPFTMELHLGLDNQVYVINTNRAMPPDNPGSDSLETITKLLRPELVSTYTRGGELLPGYTMMTSKNPIVCDECKEVVLDYEYFSYPKRHYDVCKQCFNGRNHDSFRYPVSKLQALQVPEQDRVTHWRNEELNLVTFEKPIARYPLNPDSFARKDAGNDKMDCIEASTSLQEETIREFVDDLDNLESQPLDGIQLTHEFHKRGINMRYLGRIATDVKWSHIRELSVREMLARTIKVLIRDGLSFLTDYNEADGKRVVLHYLNEIFTPEETESSLTVWKYIEELTFKKFSYAIEEHIRQKIYCLALVHSICAKLNIGLAKPKGYDFSEKAPFALDDIESIRPSIKYKPMISAELTNKREEAKKQDLKGKRSTWYLKGVDSEREMGTQLYKEVVTKCEETYGKNHVETATACFELAEQLESRHCEAGRPEHSRWNKASSIPLDTHAVGADTYYRQALEIREHLYGEYHPEVADCLMGMARVAKEESFGGDHEAFADYVIQVMEKAVDIVETTLGFQHPITAECYSQLALAYQELRRSSEDASPWIRKSFVIFMTIFGKDNPITIRCWSLLQGIEVGCDSGLVEVPIEHLVRKIEELEFE